MTILMDFTSLYHLLCIAAIVASQSLISATFSVIKQSVVLDYFPRVKVVHTSSSKEGEVYSPEVNYMILMILCVAVMLVFGDGQDIGNSFESRSAVEVAGVELQKTPHISSAYCLMRKSYLNNGILFQPTT